MPYYLINGIEITGDVGESLDGIELPENAKLKYHESLDYQSLYYDQAVDEIRLKPPNADESAYFWDQDLNVWRNPNLPEQKNLKPSPNWVGFRNSLVESMLLPMFQSTSAMNHWALLLAIIGWLQDEPLFKLNLVEVIKNLPSDFTTDNLRLLNAFLSANHFSFTLKSKDIQS